MLGLLAVMRTFVSDETGFVRQKASLPLPWTVGMIIAAAVFLSGPTASEAFSSGSVHGGCGSQSACQEYCDGLSGHQIGDCALPAGVCTCW